MSNDGTHTHHPCCSSHGVDMTCEEYRRTHFVEVRPCCADDQRILTGPLTSSEWRDFQSIPDQGYSHRHWVDQKIDQRVRAAALARCLHGELAGRCPFTACEHHGEPWNGAPTALLAVLALDEEVTAWNESVPIDRIGELRARPTAEDYRAALARDLEPQWQYTAMLTVSPGYVDSETELPPILATHRRRRAGEWEPVPEGSEVMADSITYSPS